MSTRSLVRIVKNGCPVNFYHHHDGYYEGVGAELQQWLKELMNEKGDISTWDLMHKLHADDEYEVTFWQHDAIEYFYLIDLDKKEYAACKVPCMSAWLDKGHPDYDASKPWYDQMPICIEKRDLLKDKME